MVQVLRFGSTVTLLAVVALPAVSLGDVDFIRGDVNGDGRVSVSDAYRILMWYHGDAEPPQCIDATDADDNGRMEGEDRTYLLRARFTGEPPIPPPFPEPGEDPTDDLDASLDCQAYGGGEVLEDPGSQLRILDGVSRGGDNSVALFQVSLTSSVPIGAWSMQIRVPGVTIRGYPAVYNVFYEGTADDSQSHVIGDDGFWYGTTMWPRDGIAPGGDVLLLELAACLAPGIPAGEYPIVLESGELTNAETGQAIVARLTGGTLVIENETVSASHWTICDDDLPPPRPSPESVNVTCRLSNSDVAPGGVATVLFTLRADAPIEGYSFSIDFDEELLEVLSTEYAWQRPDGSEYDFARVVLNNENERPGNTGVDEGYIVGAAYFAFRDSVSMPANAEHLAMCIRFQVRPEVSEAVTMVRFLDGGLNSDFLPVNNIVSTYGFSVTPAIANSFVFLAGRIDVVADIATFRRGDSNADDQVDVSDAQYTLDTLFLGSPPPACMDAADFNDDGRLDISDPIATLGFLFLGGGAPPHPFQDEGTDPTEDSLECRRIQ
jgi:hypothetical protein